MNISKRWLMKNSRCVTTEDNLPVDINKIKTPICCTLTEQGFCDVESGGEQDFHIYTSKNKTWYKVVAVGNIRCKYYSCKYLATIKNTTESIELALSSGKFVKAGEEYICSRCFSKQNT